MHCNQDKVSYLNDGLDIFFFFHSLIETVSTKSDITPQERNSSTTIHVKLKSKTKNSFHWPGPICPMHIFLKNKEIQNVSDLQGSFIPRSSKQISI